MQHQKDFERASWIFYLEGPMSRLQHQLTCQFQSEELVVPSDQRKFPLRQLSQLLFQFSSLALHPEYELGLQGGCCIPSRNQTLWCCIITTIPIHNYIQSYVHNLLSCLITNFTHQHWHLLFIHMLRKTSWEFSVQVMKYQSNAAVKAWTINWWYHTEWIDITYLREKHRNNPFDLSNASK